LRGEWKQAPRKYLSASTCAAPGLKRFFIEVIVASPVIQKEL
jgi:hypothetical protein